MGKDVGAQPKLFMKLHSALVWMLNSVQLVLIVASELCLLNHSREALQTIQHNPAILVHPHFKTMIEYHRI